MMKQFQITAIVDGNNLSCVLDLLRDVAVNVKMEQVAESAPPPKPNGYVNGKRNKGIKGIDLVTETFTKHNRMTMDELRKIFVRHGFAPTSCEPILSRMIRDGNVVNNDGILTWQTQTQLTLPTT